MWLNRVTPPAVTPISLAEAKTHLRVLHADDDTYITVLIQAAVDHLEGRGGILGRALVTQVWEYRVDAFPDCGGIALPFPPLQSVQTVKYLDAAGVEQTLVLTTDYVVDAEVVPGVVRLAYGKSWPATRDEPYAVRIRYIVGYGLAAAVPEPIKSALKLLVGHWYINRDMSMELPGGASFAVRSLLAPYRLPAI